MSTTDTTTIQTVLEGELKRAIINTLGAILRKAEKLEFTTTHDSDDIMAGIERSVLRSRESWFAMERVAAPWAGDVRFSVKLIPTQGLQFRTRMEVQISWSSTHRSIAEAVDAVAAYQRAVELGSYMEALWNRR